MDKKPNWLYHGFSIISDTGISGPSGNGKIRRSVMAKHEQTGTKFRMDVESESYDIQSWSELLAWDGNDWFLVVKAPTNLGFAGADGRVAPATNLAYSRDCKPDVFDGILGTLCGVAAKFVSTKDGTIYETGGGKGREGFVTFGIDWDGRHIAQKAFAINGNVFSVTVRLDESYHHQSEAYLKKFGAKGTVRSERTDLFERYAKGKDGYGAVAECVRSAFKDFSETAKEFA